MCRRSYALRVTNVKNPKTRSVHEPSEAKVLTFPEVAAYLEIPEEAVAELIAKGALPSVQIGGESRFLICAPKDPKPGSKEAVLRHFGVFREDADLEEQLAAIRARRAPN